MGQALTARRLRRGRLTAAAPEFDSRAQLVLCFLIMALTRVQVHPISRCFGIAAGRHVRVM
jgi:hypothetical protein